jgi:flagellar motor switch protein FliG
MEQPQTIALIIFWLTDIDQLAIVPKPLPENLQADVVYRIASMDSTPPGFVNKLNQVLTDEMKQAGSMVTKVCGAALQ